ncbi:Antibiotic biosynthesis monooxygenase [Stieleria maiorica]|uniref:Antibiotic biosynthesis monooxygenase n=1 Tax=Stieleria maiorica TaxID=2795974 RepID=A0A5B9MSZ4_9BACT|nr:antibiotic biosynthesis monooxygenase family protein [Stieleria maiorica]QEG02158.1 Antibiotic biosynthesis monooxygenase [Stieleria maiorica]
MIQAVLRVVAPPDKREEILQVFCSLSGPTEVAKGCRFCRVLCDADDDNAITYWAQWETREDLEDHFRSERFRRLLPYIDMSLEPPDVDVSDVDAIGGIELVLSVIRAQRQ